MVPYKFGHGGIEPRVAESQSSGDGGVPERCAGVWNFQAKRCWPRQRGGRACILADKFVK